VLELDGGHLGIEHVEAVATRDLPVRLVGSARARIQASHEYAVEVATRRRIYGRSTGVGANRDVEVVDPAAQAALALSLLRSHASSSGELRTSDRVRAMLVVRLNQLAADGNGVDPAVAEGLVSMLNAGALPPVRERGSIGTGDLSALATTALVLGGEVAPSAPLDGTVRFGAGDALAFLSSNAAAIGDAALAVAALRRLSRALLVVAAVGFHAVRGNPEAFAPAVEVATPFRGAREVCRVMRALVEPPSEPARIQDPFGLRTLPQVHGALVDRLDEAEKVVVAMANAASENPAVSAANGVAHHGGFHAVYLAQALDALVLATAQSAQLCLARTTMLAEPAITGQPAFLGDGTAGASGTMVVEYAAASALAELRALATPAGLQGVTLSRGVEDDASFASLAARQALDAVAPYRALVAAELLTALRCLRMQGARPASLEPVLLHVEGLGSDIRDRDLTEDLRLAERLVETMPELPARQ
jgi:histidine ammonia-lyase